MSDDEWGMIPLLRSGLGDRGMERRQRGRELAAACGRKGIVVVGPVPN